MFWASRTVDLNGSVLNYKKKKSQIHIFRNLQKLFLLVCYTFPDFLAAVTEFVLYWVG